MTLIKKILLTISFFTVNLCFAQDNLGINFEHNKTWAEIKEKAIKTNKIIFLDAYTTWCIPCKEMETNIFPQKEVATFFNSNFINYKLQIDQTTMDSEEIRKSYADAKSFEVNYNITAYPTYLFLNAEGTVVHYIVGGSKTGPEFIEKAKVALDPEKRYIKLRQQYFEGRRDTVFLKSLIEVATSVNDVIYRPDYVQNFLKTQTNLLTERNILYIAQSVQNSNDIGFEELIIYKNEVIPVIGEAWRNNIVSLVAFDESILPLLRHNGKKEISEGGMYSYTGEIEKAVDWRGIELMLKKRFGSDAERILINAKTTYYKWNSDWKNMNKSLIAYVTNTRAIDMQFHCNWLQYFVSYCKDAIELRNAKKWILPAASQKDFNCKKSYGMYLHHIGDFDEAYQVLFAYQKSLKKPDREIAILLEQIGSKK